MNTIQRLFFILLATFASLAHAQQNPFEQAAQSSYTGRFASGSTTLRLKPEGAGFAGTLEFQGNSYTIQAQLKQGQLQGTFKDASGSWPFSAVREGQNLQFTAGQHTEKLARVPLPKLEGEYQGDSVWMKIAAEGAGYGGTVKVQGKEMPLSARETADELAGTLGEGTNAIPFTLAVEKDGLAFRTGAFRDTLRLRPKFCQLTVTTKPEASFTLTADGRAISGRDGVFQVPAGRVSLALQAPGFKAALTTRTLAAYDADTWAVELVEITTSVNSLGMRFVEVPGTDVQFCVWETRVKDYRAYANAASGVNGDWKKFAFNLGEDHPVNCVSWDDAKAFCAWLSRKEGKTYRLPTDTEWSVAVGLPSESGTTPRARHYGGIRDLYPWGTQWPPPNDAGNYDDYSSSRISGFRDGYERTSPVGSFKPNQFGLYDLGGNVSEWCEEWYDDEQRCRVARGASYMSGYPDFLFSKNREDHSPDRRYYNLGFRVVLVDK